jgi:hypothetical protein
MAKFYNIDGTITSTDKILDEYHRRKGTQMDYNDYLTSDTLEEASKDTGSWKKVITGTKRNSDGTPNMGDVSDGYHTFDELYEHRSILFLALLSLAEEVMDFREFEGLDIECEPWYSEKHDDGTMFPGMFIAGLTSKSFGSITYHFEDKYLPLFKRSNIPHLSRAPKWDGHTPEQGLEVLKSIVSDAGVGSNRIDEEN